MADDIDTGALRERYRHDLDWEPGADVLALCDEVDRLREALDSAPCVTMTWNEPPPEPIVARSAWVAADRTVTVCIESGATRTTLTCRSSDVTCEVIDQTPFGPVVLTSGAK